MSVMIPIPRFSAFKSILAVPFLVAGLIVASISGAKALPFDVPAGPLGLATHPGTTMTIDADEGFFGFGSDAVRGLEVALGPDTIQMFPPFPQPFIDITTTGTFFGSSGDSDGSFGVTHVLENAELAGTTDTIINILDSLTLDNIGDSGTVEIELVALSLKSVNPIQISFFGGGGIRDFNVFVNISKSFGQTTGTMNLLRTGENQLQITSMALPENLALNFQDLVLLPAEDTFIEAGATLGGSGSIEFAEEIPEPVGMMFVGLGALALMRRKAARAAQ